MTSIDNILRQLDALYLQINDYNITYWSKFLLQIWLIFDSITVDLIFMMFTVDIIWLKIIILYAAIVMSACFLVIIMNAASVTYQVGKTNKILNSLIQSHALKEHHAQSEVRFKVR